ncbi:unnamed protein product [Cyprideis torosa]|uniref:Uncharacterized protein n=1 Tax=Cyprideis torosa TaxID=163714 RepID=A0A7R8WHE7_9CRUS|nr:unnamed protein product [Cyprideis torosa]CAG0892823.1 unnamed protein product [Cyprideis torosa]
MSRPKHRSRTNRVYVHSLLPAGAEDDEDQEIWTTQVTSFSQEVIEFPSTLLRKVSEVLLCQSNASKDIKLIVDKFFNSRHSDGGMDSVLKDAMWLLENCPRGDLNKSRHKSPVVSVLWFLEEWLREKSFELASNGSMDLVPKDVKEKVMEWMNNRTTTGTLRSLVSSVFHLPVNSEYLIPFVEDQIAAGQLALAAEWCNLLNLTLPLGKLALPLLARYDLTPLEAYLEQRLDDQRKIVRTLDSLIGMDRMPRIEHARSFLMFGAPHENFSSTKSLRVLCKRWIRKWRLEGEEDLFPNLLRAERIAYLHHILYRFYDGLNTTENFREIVFGELHRDPDLIPVMLGTLFATRRGEEEGVLVAAAFNVDSSGMSRHLQKQIRDAKYSVDFGRLPFRPPNSLWNEQGSLNPLGPSGILDVVYVQAEDHFMDMLQEVSQCNRVAIDSEWGTASALGSSPVALLQIAVDDHRVFLIDFLALKKRLQEGLIVELFQVLLGNNPNRLVIGYGLGGDFNILLDEFSSLAHEFITKPSFFKAQLLDLQWLWCRELTKFPRIFFQRNCSQDKKGLQDLTMAVYGETLEKKEQVSRWENRPLRSAQVKYAAKDALILLRLERSLSSFALDAGLPWLDWLKQSSCHVQRDCLRLSRQVEGGVEEAEGAAGRGKRRGRGGRGAKSLDPAILLAKLKREDDCSSPGLSGRRPARELKVVVDTMLQGLGKNLRSVGVDCRILENSETHQHCVEYSNEENRVILTRGLVYQKLSRHVPSGMCYQVVADNLIEQVKEVIEFFNISVLPADVFSRCQVCNSDDFQRLSPDSFKSLLSPGPHASFPTDPPGQFFYYANSRIPRSFFLEETCDKSRIFYICEMCEKVYWDGSHYGKVLAGRYREVISNAEDLHSSKEGSAVVEQQGGEDFVPCPVLFKRQVENCNYSSPRNLCAAWLHTSQTCTKDTACAFLQANMFGVSHLQYCECPGSRACPLIWDSEDGRSITQGSDQYKFCETVSPVKHHRCNPHEIAHISQSYFNKTTDEHVFTRVHLFCTCPGSSRYTMQDMREGNDRDFEVVTSIDRCAPIPPCEWNTPCKTVSVTEELSLVSAVCSCPNSLSCPSNGVTMETMEFGGNILRVIGCQ